MLPGTYKTNEIFFSLQGEGIRIGTANVFVRFSHCNLKCSAEGEIGFNCDTEFSSGTAMSRDELLAAALATLPAGVSAEQCGVIFTGGEPGLQLDQELVDIFRAAGFLIAIETNGTMPLPSRIDWICVSPKSAEHTLIQPAYASGEVRAIDELKYVRHVGQAIPKPSLKALSYLISPAFEADGSLTIANLTHCIKLCKENPPWRLSLQYHKMWGIR